MKPIFIENSKLPVWLSKIAPINVWAVSIGWWVWCRGELTETQKTHETIHFHQQLEMLFVFQWMLYGIFWLVGMAKHGDGKKAYYNNPFEQEAYTNESDGDYLNKRTRYAGRNYKV